MSLTYAAAVKKNIKAKNEATKSIQTLFKAVVSVKNAPTCSKEGCKQKAKFGFNAPPIFLPFLAFCLKLKQRHNSKCLSAVYKCLYSFS
jgi:hypothetical protein